MRALLLIFAFVIMGSSETVWAQNGDADYQQRLKLAGEMHEIRPINMEAETIIEDMALQFPEDKRQLFITRMMEVFDKKSLTEISVKAMADTFTAAELQQMIAYNSSPEGKAINEKMPVYQSLVQPELIKKIDKALMEVRTGRTGN